MTQKIIITGAMGSGKSTVLSELSQQGLFVFEEPARKILAEQRLINGYGVPEKDSFVFTHLLLSRSIHYYYEADKSNRDMVLFDRGIADNIAYAKLFNLDVNPFESAASSFKFNPNVFFLPAWENIYTTDDERKMTYEQSRQFGDQLKEIYQRLGYNLIEVPKTSPLKRAKFILGNL